MFRDAVSEELTDMLSDFFAVSDFAEMIGVSVKDLVAAFPDEVYHALPDLKEIMGVEEEQGSLFDWELKE